MGGGGLAGAGYPDVQAGWRGDVDPVVGERLDGVFAALGVDLGGALHRRDSRGVGPECRYQALEEVADPLGADELAAADLADGVGVASEHRHAQVWTQGLGDRAGRGPALAIADRGGSRSARDRPEVVVLDNHELRGASQDGGKRACALGVVDRSGGVLPARSEDDGLGPVVERLLKRAGDHPALVDLDWPQRKPESAQEMKEAGIAGILNADEIARAKPGRQGALDPIQRAADHGEVLPGYAG